MLYDSDDYDVHMNNVSVNEVSEIQIRNEIFFF